MNAFRLARDFGRLDVAEFMEEISNETLAEWSWFYKSTEWDDARWEVFRLRFLIGLFGETDDAMPDWQYPYESPKQETVQDQLARLKAKAKELRDGQRRDSNNRSGC